MRKCKCVQIVDKEDGCFLNATASVFLGVVGIVSVQGSGNELVGRCSAEKKGEEKKNHGATWRGIKASLLVQCYDKHKIL